MHRPQVKALPRRSPRATHLLQRVVHSVYVHHEWGLSKVNRVQRPAWRHPGSDTVRGGKGWGWAEGKAQDKGGERPPLLGGGQVGCAVRAMQETEAAHPANPAHVLQDAMAPDLDVLDF